MFALTEWSLWTLAVSVDITISSSMKYTWEPVGKTPPGQPHNRKADPPAYTTMPPSAAESPTASNSPLTLIPRTVPYKSYAAAVSHGSPCHHLNTTIDSNVSSILHCFSEFITNYRPNFTNLTKTTKMSNFPCATSNCPVYHTSVERALAYV